MDNITLIDRNNLQFLGKMVDNALPDNTGFCVLVFPFNDTDKRLSYISNGNREDVAKAMKEWLQKVDNESFGKDI